MTATWHNHVIGLTGTSGSGKSTAAEILSKLGAFVVSADSLAREAVKPQSEGLKQVVTEFGRSVLLPDGSLDRRALGKIIFSEPERRKALEKIIHPIVGELARAAFEAELKRGNRSPLVYDCPLLFEANLDRFKFKLIVLITTAEETAVQRIMKRDAISEIEARQRIRSQMDVAQKTARADVVIQNDGTIEELKKQLTVLVHP